MELICPSCEARYSIPTGAIGEKGRQVSCMNCGHGWHAYPPLVLGSAEAGTSASGLTWKQAEPQPSVTSPGPSWNAGTTQVIPPKLSQPEEAEIPRPSAGKPNTLSGESPRNEQLAAIREMLAEVQSEERASEAVTGEKAGAAGGGQADQYGRTGRDARQDAAVTQKSDDPPMPLGFEDSDEVDPLRRRMALMEERKEQESRSTDVGRLRRRHDRRVNRKTHAEKAGSGAFLTGFLLVAIIASVMISLYLLHPQIIARMP
ncbi:MAG: zinc-ribbon domain-containing protein, partial [Pseudomonadota bacterium]